MQERNGTTTSQPTPAPWPDNVIARYLTVGGATVDLTHRHSETRSKCSGCGTHKDHTTKDFYYSHGEPVYFQNRDTADHNAREWAQTHAETCRAIPRPDTQ